jgi:hypothetical protein
MFALTVAAHAGRLFSQNSKIALDNPLIYAILISVDNCAWSAGACSRFSFSSQAISAFATPSN